MLAGKHILLGVTGSIAAYKAAFLIRLLVREGAKVRVIMTEAACAFIQPLTLSTLSKNPVITRYTDDPASGVWNNHVELAQWADLQLIAPASANTLAKMASGLCDNVLMATYLSAKSEVCVAPAMDLDMYQHATTRENLERLQVHGVRIIPAGDGELASGLHGPGRMAEPEEIVQYLKDRWASEADLEGKKVLVSAGPTREAWDPVRYLSNHSTGKMGYALAEEAAQRGAKVILVTGPTNLIPIHPNIKRIPVESAAEMHQACVQHAPDADVVIMSAAVSDYTPVETASEKIKKSQDEITLTLRKTTDILAELGKQKPAKQILVGFALETENEKEHARAKRERKNLDFIVLNSLRDAGSGFGHDTNRITILDRDNKEYAFELKSKTEVARDILNTVLHAGE